ncbi:MAG: PLP-dependent aminotransferase family protein [Candidatus Promineifilaceae bacterium]|jgi:DNA-binding transcriptional MocR family regulator
MSLLITIDAQSKKPIFRQIIEQITEMVDSDAIKPGWRLPSTRSMADKLEVNRSTVYRAYEELWSLGYLESRPGSYTTVRRRTKIISKQNQPARSLIKWPDRITAGVKAIHSAHLRDEALVNKASTPDIINFIPLSPDSRLLPIDAFRKCLNEVLVTEGGELLQYGSPAGYGPLRKFISERMREHSISITPDEIMITSGAQNAFELLLRLLAEPGSKVAVEAPTYSRAIDILCLRNVEIIEIPMRSEGMNLNILENLVKRQPPVLIYTIPNFQNPTGITTDQSHRERLIGICERYAIPLVEDGFEEEMKYFGKAVLPIKSMDRNKVVIYIGTFSKILFPGLRIGWIAAAKECIDHLIPLQRTSIISGNILDQAALFRFCKSGHYDLHIKRMHSVYRKRMQKALKAMQTYFNKDHIEWTVPTGGYTIWIRLRGKSAGEDGIIKQFIDHKVAVLPGSSYFYGASDGMFFRISIAHLDEETIEEGIRRLGMGLNEIYKRQNKRR